MSSLNSGFKSCPPFTAISYAWDPYARSPHDFRSRPQFEHESGSAATKKILVNDAGYVMITEHLLAALCAVKGYHALIPHESHDTERDQHHEWIFADAICIDQRDARDKATQVAGMNEVFQRAERVCIWLGLDLGLEKEYEGLAAAIEYLLGVLRRYLGPGSSKSEYPDGSTTRNVMNLFELSLPPPKSLFWKSLEALRFNAWFSRLWVVQEAILARDAVLLWGQSGLLWSSYCDLTMLCEEIIGAFFSNGGIEASGGHSSEFANALCYAYNSRVSAFLKLQKSVLTIMNIDRGRGDVSGSKSEARADQENIEAFRSRAGASHVQVLASIIRSSRASVAVDRVYAILGLLPQYVREGIRVEYTDFLVGNYHIKWAQLFQTIISFSPATAEFVFSDATYLDGHVALPSWCPNLEDDGEKRGILGACLWAGAGLESRRNINVSDNYDNMESVKPVPDTLALRVSGLTIDKVAHVVDLSWTKASLNWARMYISRDNHIDPKNAKRLLDTLETCSRYANTNAENEVDIASCLVAHSYDGKPQSRETLTEDYTAFKTYLTNQCEGKIKDTDYSTAMKAAALRFGNHFQALIRKRAFFVTENGRPGLTSHRVREGDILCIFSGFRLPYVLRRRLDTEESYELIGEAYVHGIMQGECLNEDCEMVMDGSSGMSENKTVPTSWVLT